jgi:hypothetical protein
MKYCNQCKRCRVENTAVLGCADEDCRCHTDHICGGELCIVCGYRKKIKKEYTHPDCEHQCTSNCRRNGCNCLCGEYHGRLDVDEYNEIIKERNCEYWVGSERCTDKKVDGSIFCRFHSDNLPI